MDCSGGNQLSADSSESANFSSKRAYAYAYAYAKMLHALNWE
jgi:hypothetical protein